MIADGGLGIGQEGVTVGAEAFTGAGAGSSKRSLSITARSFWSSSRSSSGLEKARYEVELSARMRSMSWTSRGSRLEDSLR